LTNTALDLLGVGGTDTACLWTKNFASHSRYFRVIGSGTIE